MGGGCLENGLDTTLGPLLVTRKLTYAQLPHLTASRIANWFAGSHLAKERSQLEGALETLRSNQRANKIAEMKDDDAKKSAERLRNRTSASASATSTSTTNDTETKSSSSSSTTRNERKGKDKKDDENNDNEGDDVDNEDDTQVSSTNNGTSVAPKGSQQGTMIALLLLLLVVIAWLCLTQ
jgi:cobalamin biosynthesis Mg chelatase CobN